MIGFREALEKARAKSQYAIGKHPNSHKKGPGTEEPSSSLSDTQRIFLENLRYNNGGRFRIPTAKWAVKTGHATYDFESDKYKITQKGLDATKPKAPTDHANKVAMDHVSAPYHPKANAARRQAMKDLIAHQSDPRERGIGIDLDTGERLYDTMGTAGKGYEWDADFERAHVPMHEAITAREKNKSRRTLESHTHPKSRMGFSEGDWGVLMGTSEMHEMRVVSNDRIFAATKTKEFFKLPYSMRTPRQARKRQEELVEEEFQSNKHATVEDMVDAANRRMGKEFGIKYREVRRPKGTVSKSFTEVLKVSDKAKRRLMQFSTQRLNRRRALARGNKSAAASLASVSRSVGKSFDQIYKFNEALHPRDEDGQFANKLSDGDVGELKGYSTSGGSYDRVNSGLRSGKDMSADPTVAALDRAFAAQAEAAPSVVYRGLGGYEVEELDLKVGKEFVDPGFTSTTTEKKSAVKFATNGDMKLEGEQVGIVFKINTKKSPSLDMNRFSNYEEQETLLNRGTRFKVTGIKPGVAGKTLAQVTLTVVPN